MASRDDMYAAESQDYLSEAGSANSLNADVLGGSASSNLGYNSMQYLNNNQLNNNQLQQRQLLQQQPYPPEMAPLQKNFQLLAETEMVKIPEIPEMSNIIQPILVSGLTVVASIQFNNPVGSL